MGKVSEYITNLITKQIQDHGIVVWYDPEVDYLDLVNRLDVPELTILCFKASFFRLRAQIEPFLEFIDEEGKPRPDCEVPPKLLIYVPKSRSDSQRALIEAECAGVIMEPGSKALPRNTRLKVIAEHVFKEIAPDALGGILEQIDKGTLKLDELDKLSKEVEGISSGTVKLIFGTAAPLDIVLNFVASSKHHQALEEKQALPELARLIQKELGIDFSQSCDITEARKILERTLLITELLSETPREKRPEEFTFISLPEQPEHISKIVEICKQWRNRLDFQSTYINTARRVQKELGLNKVIFPSDALCNLETFPFIEEHLLQKAEALILEGKSKKALDIANERKNSFWSTHEPTFHLHWKLIENIAQAILAGDKIKHDIKVAQNDPAKMVRLYTTGESPWCELDTYCRHLESQYASFDLDLGDRHDDLVEVIIRVRQTYTEVLEEVIERFCDALINTGFRIHGFLLQREIFNRYVLPHIFADKRTAYVLVDALRFEMGKELSEGLTDEFEIKVVPAIAELPAITTVGMAALLPGADKGLELTKARNGKLGVRIGKRILYSRASRMKHLKESVETEPYICKLNDLIKPSKRRQAQIKKCNFIVVTSQEIDRLGEEGSQEDEVRLYMDEVLDKLRKAIRRLAFLGIEHFVITADHGHIFNESVESGMKMDPPGGKTFELHRRVWIGKGGKVGDGYIRLKTGDLGLKGDFELAFPTSLSCFKARGGSESFFHGGISLQEMVVPAVILDKKEFGGYEAEIAAVKLSFRAKKITTRFFSVKTTYISRAFLGPEEVRVKVLIISEGKQVGEAVTSEYGFEEGTKEIVLRKDTPNMVTLRLTYDKEIEKVSLHVIDAISGKELRRMKNIPVEISI